MLSLQSDKMEKSQVDLTEGDRIEIIKEKDRIISQSEQAITIISVKESLKQSAYLGATIGLNLLIGTAGMYLNTVLLAHVDNEGKNLAASNLINSYENVVISSSNAILFSVSSCVGNAFGARNLREIPSILKNGVIIAGVLTFVSLPLILTSGLILKGLKQPPELVDITQDYFDGYAFGVPAYFLLGIQQQISFGTFNTLPANVINFANVTLTVGVGFILMYGKLNFPAFGARGLGYATSISNWVSLIGFTAYLKYSSRFRDLDLIALSGNWFDKEILKKLVSIGFPIGLQVGIEFTSLIISTAIIGMLMTIDDLKANEVAIQYIFAAVVPICGIGQATSILTSQASGRKNLLDARRLAYVSLGLGSSFSILALTLFSTIPNQLMSPFLNVEDPNNARIVGTTRYLLVINGANQILEGIRIISAGALQGTFANTVYAMVASGITMCLIAVPVGYALGFPAGLGVTGIYLGRSIGMFLGGTAVMGYWYKKISAAILGSPQLRHVEINQNQSAQIVSESERSRQEDAGGLHFSYNNNTHKQSITKPLLEQDKPHTNKWRCNIL